MPRDFEARRQRGIGVLRHKIGHSLLEQAEKSCLAVLEAEPERKLTPYRDVRHDEWQRLCTIILDGLGVE